MATHDTTCEREAATGEDMLIEEYAGHRIEMLDPWQIRVVEEVCCDWMGLGTLHMVYNYDGHWDCDPPQEVREHVEDLRNMWMEE